MSSTTMRSLPAKRNPHVTSDASPEYDDLISLRRLGRTKLQVKPGQVGTSNATKVENLGPVEYAHLRAPLPANLKGSGIFEVQEGHAQPETYFLMRRSKDGFVSATGMFKIAFPWASQAEEKAEREHLKNMEDETSQDEIAGNVWVKPEFALELAAEYGLTLWIRALLDPTDITQSPAGGKKPIQEPPKFDLPQDDSVKTTTTTKTPRARSTRSLSPVKASGTPARPIKSPKKRQTKKEKEASIAQANAASASLQSALEGAASTAGGEESTPAPESSIAESSDIPAPTSENVVVELDQAVEVNGDTEVTHTNVTVTMPAGLPELPLPEDTEAMLEKAKQMVEEARALDAAAVLAASDEAAPASSPKAIRKRKAEDIEPSDIDTELPLQPAKKARVLEEKLKREKVRNRAIVGVTAMLGIAAAIPYFF